MCRSSWNLPAVLNAGAVTSIACVVLDRLIERLPPDRLVMQLAEPALNQIQPAAAGRDEMQFEALTLQPATQHSRAYACRSCR